MSGVEQQPMRSLFVALWVLWSVSACSLGSPAGPVPFGDQPAPPEPSTGVEPGVEPSFIPEPRVVDTPTPEPFVREPEQPSTPIPEPTGEPEVEPSTEPVAEPIAEPGAEPSAEPEVEPGAEPMVEPIAEPTAEPEPVANPVAEPEPASEPEQPEPAPEPEPVAEPQPEMEACPEGALGTEEGRCICIAGQRSALCEGFVSCRDILEIAPVRQDGVYVLETPDGTAMYDAYCDMTTEGGGWTLVLKADGSQDIFHYESEFWTNDSLLNEEALDLQVGNAKYQAFVSVPVEEVLVGVRQRLPGGSFVEMRSTRFRPHQGFAGPVERSSMRALLEEEFNDGDLVAGERWLNLLQGERFSRGALCERGGINRSIGTIRVRLGYVNACQSVGWIGVGGFISQDRPERYLRNTVGGRWAEGNNGPTLLTFIEAFGVVFVR